MLAIQTINLVKKFRELTAVDEVNLEINEKECFGLLGPNGAGKTSLIRMITAVSPSSAGQIVVKGKDLRTNARQVKAMLGVVPQIDNLDPELTVMGNLIAFSRYFDISAREARRRAGEVLKLFELQTKTNSNIRELSGGMKRRLLIARGLINQPQILILDEPTVGLDPQSRHLVWNKLRELKSLGVTQLLCTQNMQEAVELCDRVAVMYQGKIVTTDSPRNLITRYVGEEVLEIDIRSQDRENLIKELKSRGYEFETDGQTVQLFHINSDSFIASLDENKYKPHRRTATLEDVFFKLTGRSLVE